MRLFKAAFMLIIIVDVFIIILALIVLNPLLVLLFILVSSVLKGIHNQLIDKQKLTKFYPLRMARNRKLF